MDKNFKKTRALAVAEAVRLNDENGYYRWKTVTMNDKGVWSAHEAMYVRMAYSHDKDSWIIPEGASITLDIPKFGVIYRECAYVPKSLSIVHMFL